MSTYPLTLAHQGRGNQRNLLPLERLCCDTVSQGGGSRGGLPVIDYYETDNI